MAAFCRILRVDHEFGIGPRETRDALRAIEAVGIADIGRFRAALRLVCCASYDETRVFERAFESFFLEVPGVPQPAYAPRHTRPGREPKAAVPTRRGNASRPNDDSDDEGSGSAAERRPTGVNPAEASAWQMLRARYSPTISQGTAPFFEAARLSAMRSAADRLVRGVRLGRTRRWKAMEGQGRFDIGRTMRASLKTAGDPVALRFLGHPLRNPRFVVLVDGSRSMDEHTTAAVAFAAALCERSSRTSVFFFSTTLRDVTHDLRRAARTGANLSGLGEAWGGGTKIGSSLALFLDQHGARSLSPETVVIVCSDGLDVGDIEQLALAMREIERRSAGIVWLNPHAATPGYVPISRGMRAALPFVSLLSFADDAQAFERLAMRIGRMPRIRGRRR